MFETTAWIALGAVVGVAAVRAFGTRGRRDSSDGARKGSARFGRVDRVLQWGLAVSFLVLFATGFHASLIAGRPLAGAVLVLHCAAGLVFAVALALAALAWADECRFSPRARRDAGVAASSDRFDAVEKTLFWLLCGSGLVSVLSVLVGMLPVFGPAAIADLVEVHRYGSLLASCCILAYTLRKITPPTAGRRARAAGAGRQTQDGDR
jgi:cytochrome b subunit of formate dehydrogenase